MSLLQSLPYKEYQKALQLTKDQCELIASIAKLRNLSFEGSKKPGESLTKAMDRQGLSADQYREILDAALRHQIYYYRPQAKVAILIGNDKYVHLGKLATPSKDCDSLSIKLKKLGFTVITLNNVLSSELKSALKRLFEVIPEDSYCFIFYAGHGCELYNIKCMLSIDCPTENIQSDHFITENFLLSEIAVCKPELTVLVMDMCRVNLDRTTNSSLLFELLNTPEYCIHKNLLISYATASAASAYEVLQIECSHTIDCDVTYELRTGDLVVEGASQYAAALCSRLTDNVHVCEMIDKVHEDVENAPKKQRPIKMQCGVFKRSLRDPVIGEVNELMKKLEVVAREFNESGLVL